MRVWSSDRSYRDGFSGAKHRPELLFQGSFSVARPEICQRKKSNKANLSPSPNPCPRTTADAGVPAAGAALVAGRGELAVPAGEAGSVGRRKRTAKKR